MRSICTLPIFLVSLCSVPALGADGAEDLLKTIQSADAADVDRANAFEKIGDIAGDEAVEPLAGFLGDKKWSHYARFALQKMEGPRVTRALLRSLDEVQGELKLGVIGTIGRRRDPAAVAPLESLLAGEDAETVDAAAVALGWIGTSEAAAALTRAFGAENDSARKASLGSALLLAGQNLVKSGKTQEAVAVFDLLRDSEAPKPCRIAATQHAILARGAEGVGLMVEQLTSADRDQFQVGLAVARVLPGEKATRGLIDLLTAETSPGRSVLLILAIKDRGDETALPAVLAKVESDSQAVQTAAIDAVGVLGNAASVPILLSAAKGPGAEAALGALVALRGSEVNAALMEAAKAAPSSTTAVQALGRRRAKEAVDLLFELSRSDSEAVAREAIVALGKTVPDERFLDLVALLTDPKRDSHKGAIQEAVHAAIIRSTQPDVCAEALGAMIPGASGSDRAFLFEQIRTAGGVKAVAWMRRFATGSDESLQDAATKELGQWLSAEAAPALLEVAQGRGKYANRALAGYIRLFRQFELPEAERVAMAAEALKVASRPNERNAALDAMTRFPCVGTFELALGQLDAPGSGEAAAKAALTIARTVLDLDPEKGNAGLKRLIEANINQSVTDSAKALLKSQKE